VDLNLRTFRCEPDNENHTTDLWQGILEENEDPRNIYFDHPIDESEMCTFPVELGMGLIQGAGLTDTAMTFETRNCPESMTEGKGDFCYGFSSSTSSESESEIEFLADAIAGYSCVGGKYDGKDSNEAPEYITKEDCIDIGGGTEYNPNTCREVQIYLEGASSLLGDETVEYLRTEWFQPKCCTAAGTEESNQVEASDVEVSDVEVSDVEVSDVEVLDVSSSFSLSSATALVAMAITTFMASLSN